MHGQPTRELYRLDPAHDLAERIRKGLAMITADEPGQILAVAVDELAIREEDMASGNKRHVAPCGEGPPGGGHREVDLYRTATRNAGDDRPSRGIEDRSRPFRRDLDGAPIDPVTEDGNSAFGDSYWRRCHCEYLFKPTPASRFVDCRPLITILRAGDLFVQMTDVASIIWTVYGRHVSTLRGCPLRNTGTVALLSTLAQISMSASASRLMRSRPLADSRSAAMSSG